MSRLPGTVRQNGYVVRDVDEAMRHWTSVLGVGPFYYMERVSLDWFRHRGEESSPELSIALANSGEMQIELICQRNRAPTMYQEFLARSGEGLQHIAYWSNTYQADYHRLISEGLAVGQEGQIGGPEGRFAYFDTELHPGTVVELSDVSGPKGKFFEHIRAAADDWDGSRPIRPIV